MTQTGEKTETRLQKFMLPTIIAIVGAIIGGIVSASICFYSIELPQKEEETIVSRISILEKDVSRIMGQLDVITAMKTNVSNLESKVSKVEKKMQEATAESIIQTPNEENAEVTYKQRINGTFSTAEKDLDLWILVQPEQSPQFHPQIKVLKIQREMRWSTVAYFGTSVDDDIGNAFKIVFVSATPDASTVFSNYLDNAKKQNNYEGIESLPNGVTILDELIVKKYKN